MGISLWAIAAAFVATAVSITCGLSILASIAIGFAAAMITYVVFIVRTIIWLKQFTDDIHLSDEDVKKLVSDHNAADRTDTHVTHVRRAHRAIETRR